MLNFAKLFGRRARRPPADSFETIAPDPRSSSKPSPEFRKAVESFFDHGIMFPETLPLLNSYADSGDNWARFCLGKLAANGFAQPKDEQRAAELFELAAEAGYAPAQSAIGLMYISGRGVAADTRAGLKWIMLAAESGDSGAQFNLARAYSSGIGIAADDVTAAKWMSKAANSGLADAQLGIAVWTLLGRGVPRDRHRAAELLKPLAIKGDREAARWLSKALTDDEETIGD